MASVGSRKPIGPFVRTAQPIAAYIGRAACQRIPPMRPGGGQPAAVTRCTNSDSASVQKNVSSASGVAPRETTSNIVAVAMAVAATRPMPRSNSVVPSRYVSRHVATPNRADPMRYAKSPSPNTPVPSSIIQYMNGGFWIESSPLKYGTIHVPRRPISAAVPAHSASS